MSAVHTAAIPLRAAADDDDDDLALLDGHLPSDAGRFETSGITTAAMAPAAASLPALIPAPASEPGVGDLPARYQAACRALAEAKNVDEVLQIRDRVEAIRACARIAENRQLEIDAAEIRHRAERKLGELIILQKQTVGLNAGAIGTPGPGRGHTGPQENAVTDADRVLKPTLTDAGISKNLSSQAQKLARMSPDEFEQRVENWREKLGTRVTVGLLDTAHVRGTLGTGENDWHTPAIHLDVSHGDERICEVDMAYPQERVAIEVIRHHRLLELYLAETLGVHVDDVHEEADKLEHAISEELEERIDKALGFPTHDPHGDPIPDANLEWPARPSDRRTRPRAASDTPRG